MSGFRITPRSPPPFSTRTSNHEVLVIRYICGHTLTYRCDPGNPNQLPPGQRNANTVCDECEDRHWSHHQQTSSTCNQLCTFAQDDAKAHRADTFTACCHAKNVFSADGERRTNRVCYSCVEMARVQQVGMKYSCGHRDDHAPNVDAMTTTEICSNCNKRQEKNAQLRSGDTIGR